MLQLVAQMGKSWGLTPNETVTKGETLHGMRTARDYVMTLRWLGHRKQPDPSHEQCDTEEAILHETARMQAQERMSCSPQLLRRNPLLRQTTERV